MKKFDEFYHLLEKYSLFRKSHFDTYKVFDFVSVNFILNPIISIFLFHIRLVEIIFSFYRGPNIICYP